MATKEKAEATAAAFSKEQILTAKKYKDRRDLLHVLLEDNMSYTLVEVDQIVDKFMKKGVK